MSSEWSIERNQVTLRPTEMDVDLDALVANYQSIRTLVAPAKVMAVVKANAYGQGLVPCARALAESGADSFGVALVEEGIELRRAGVTTPILVLGAIYSEQVEQFLQYDLDITASSISKLQTINDVACRFAKRARVHLKIDTGMERTGVHYYSVEQFLEAAAQAKCCEIVGVYSSFACADEIDLATTKLQLSRFLEVREKAEQAWGKSPMWHIANSAAALRLRESHLDMVRVGLALYGVYPQISMRENVELKRVMTLRSKVVYFKVVRAGAGVSYGHTWRAEEDTRVVTIPVGYADGYFRRLSNIGSVLIRGNRYPIIGTICMDQMMVNIGNGIAYNGDEVVLIGSQGCEEIMVNDVAHLVATTPHEVLTTTSLRVPRRYFRAGSEVK